MGADNKPQKLNDTNFITLVVSLSVISLVTAIVIGNTTVKQIRLQNKVIAKKTAAAKTIEQNVKNARSLTSEYDNMSEGTKEKLKTSLPNNEDSGGLANMLESMTGQVGMRFKNINPDTALASSTGTEAEKTTIPQKALYTLVLEGNYQALSDFIRNMESASRPMSPTIIDIQGSTNALKINLTLETYFQDPADISLGKETVQ